MGEGSAESEGVMDDLDFSALTDDQLVGLFRALLREAASRNPALQAAMQGAMLDEGEKAKIQREAADREAMKIRAQERERVARESAEAVRRQHEAQEKAAQAAASAQKRQEQEEANRRAQEDALRIGREKAAQARATEAQEMEWLIEAARLVEEKPEDIMLCVYDGRVLINPGSNRYTRTHYADWDSETNKISTVREIVANKIALIEFCARWWNSPGSGELIGANYQWERNNVAAN
jgi:hypothetical protein